MGVRLFREREVVARMQVGDRRVVELLGCELADRLEHPEAVARTADETLVDKRLKYVEVGAGDCLRRVERATAAEGAEAREETRLICVEEVVRPRDRGAQRLLPWVCVAATSQE